jgi:hypothetical protein
LKKLAHIPNSSQFLTPQQEDMIYNQLKLLISNSQNANGDGEKKLHTAEQKKQIAALVRYSAKLHVRHKKRLKNQTPVSIPKLYPEGLPFV